MRIVSQKVCSAFMQRKAKMVGNTHTDGDTLFLHGNAIARHLIAGGNHFTKWTPFEISFAGWPTVTTRDRLNSLPGVSVWQRNHEQWLSRNDNVSKLEFSELRLWFPIVDWHTDEWTCQQLGLLEKTWKI